METIGIDFELSKKNLGKRKLVIKFLRKELIISNQESIKSTGYHNGHSRVICLNNKNNLKWMISTFCHELAHAYCYKIGKYKKYHYNKVKFYIKKKNYRGMVDIERKIDFIGKELFIEYGFNRFFEYKRGYTHLRKDIKFLKEYYSAWEN